MKYSVIVAHKGKNNTSFETVKCLFLFVHSQYQENSYLKKKENEYDALAVPVLNTSASQK